MRCARPRLGRQEVRRLGRGDVSGICVAGGRGCARGWADKRGGCEGRTQVDPLRRITCCYCLSVNLVVCAGAAAGGRGIVHRDHEPHRGRRATGALPATPPPLRVSDHGARERVCAPRHARLRRVGGRKVRAAREWVRGAREWVRGARPQIDAAPPATPPFPGSTIDAVPAVRPEPAVRVQLACVGSGEAARDCMCGAFVSGRVPRCR